MSCAISIKYMELLMMIRSNIPQVIFLKIFPILIIISCLLLKVCTGQDESEDWPIVTDPFPDDEIGPEEPPTPPPPPDCSLACQEKVDEAMQLIRTLEEQLTQTNNTLLDRIITLEGNTGDITMRVSNFESYLPGNVTLLMDKINNDVSSAQSQLSGDLGTLRNELEAKISSIPTGGNGGTQVMDVYLNLTQRINGLENGKIQHLIVDNNLWRQNFRVVNATFAKLKKSSSSNKVIITG